MSVCDSLARNVTALTTLCIFLGFVIACLSSFIMLLMGSPEHVLRLRAWVAAVKRWNAP